MSTRSSFACLVLAGLLWGTGGLTGHALADSTGWPGPAVAAARLTCGGGLLVAVQVARRIPVPRGRSAWGRIAAVAALAAVFQSAYFGAVAAGTVSAATLIAIGSAPIFVVAAEAVRTRRRPTASALRPVLIGIVGLGLLVGAPASGTTGAASLAAAGLAALSGAAFAGFTMLGRRPLVDLDERSAIGYGFTLGGAALAIASAPFVSGSLHLSLRGVGLLVVLATGPTALAYSLFFRGLRAAAASTATVVALLEPLTATVLAVTLFGEHLRPIAAAGAVLLLTSVVVAGRVELRRPAPVVARPADQ